MRDDPEETDDAPETSDKTADLVEWDEPPDARGESAPKVLPEDEVSPAESSVRAGVEEADREQRIAAADAGLDPEEIRDAATPEPEPEE